MVKTEGSFAVEDMKNVQINIGAVVKEEEEWDQPMDLSPSQAWQRSGNGITR